MLFGALVIVGVFFLLLYMVGHTINIIDNLWRNRTQYCPYCGIKGHGKRFHVPKG